MPSVAEVLAGQIASRGTEVVFGLPGGENVEMLDALRQFEFVLVRNESSACMMAATYARLTGKPGVALTTLGPGATNAYAGLAHAYLDRAPVLLITAQTEPDLIGHHTHQVVDLQACFRPVTKFTAELEAHNAASTIDHALNVLQSGRPGPVHLGICNRVARETITVEGSVEQPAKAQLAHLPDAVERLAAAERPVILTGLGLEPDKPYTELQALAEQLGAPVIDTPKSKGALSAGHPLFAGTIGLTHTDPVYEVLDDADCILAVGFDVVELVKPWEQPQPLIWAANWRNQDPKLPAACELVGSLTTILQALLNDLPTVTKGWGRGRVKAFRRARVAEPQSAPGRVSPQAALRALQENTPPDVTVTTDVGSHKIFTALNWEAHAPNRYFVSNGMSVMGFGLTSAIAAAYVTREPVVCVTGDAGLAMVQGEMALAAEHDLPLTVFLMNDNALDLIRSAQKRRGRAVFGTEFTNPDYAHIAAAYGYTYFRVQNRDDCAAAVRRTMHSLSPALIDVWVDPSGYPTTPQE